MTANLMRRAAELARQMSGQWSGSPPAGDGAVLAGLVIASSVELLTAEVRSLRSQIQKLRELLDDNSGNTEKDQ